MRPNSSPIGMLATAALALAALALVPAASGKPTKPANLPKHLEAGFKAWTVKCSQCHEPERAYSAKYAELKKAQALVSRMARKPGASIPKTDQKRIAEYLSWVNSRNK